MTRSGRSGGVLLAALLAVGGGPLAAQCPDPDAPLCLPRLFQDGIVMQRGVDVPVWGWARPGASVTVALAGSVRTAVADRAGEWSVTFPPLAPGGSHSLTVTRGDVRLDVRDIVAGDVWVASGQSNMEWPLARDRQAPAAVAAARDSLLREFAVPHSWAMAPAPDLAGGAWSRATPESAGRFSAVAYYFARELRAATGVPIGIIHTSWGGSNIETWMSRRALGLDDGAWDALVRREHDRQAAIQDSLRALLGPLPATDTGLADGRPLWADPALDDAGWTTLAVPGLWESTYPGLDGTAWYRTSFELTAAEAAAGGRLSLGTIDDDDITWINATEVGRTSGYAERRVYDVPPAALSPGRNVLAIRVTDGAGGGGPYGEAAALFLEVGGARHPLAGNWKFRVGSVSLQPDGQYINKLPAALYHRMLHPLLRCPIRGVIWYQGESNANNAAQAAAYRTLFQDLIRSWRREWRGGGDFPFLWVQLPNYGRLDQAPPEVAAWAILRESQAAALALPGTGQAVAIDVGDPADIHPRDKAPVGRRLALAARRVAYGEQVTAAAPSYRRHAAGDGRITIEFNGDGVVTRLPDGEVAGFAIAGADRRWVWARARLEGDRVVVWSDQVTEPVAVRYAWADSPPAASLFGREGLPVAPFRTDTW